MKSYNFTMLALVEAGPAWRRPQISNLSIKSQRGSNFHWNHWKTQGKSMKIHRWRNASNGANLGRCWRSDFLHTSNDFLMILVSDALKMTSKIMKIWILSRNLKENWTHEISWFSSLMSLQNGTLNVLVSDCQLCL